MIEMVYILHRLRENITLRRDKAKSLITFVITVESTLSCLSFYIVAASSNTTISASALKRTTPIIKSTTRERNSQFPRQKLCIEP